MPLPPAARVDEIQDVMSVFDYLIGQLRAQEALAGGPLAVAYPAIVGEP